MKIIKAESAGFCFGVKRAVDTVYKCTETGTDEKIYTYGPIIHNEEVVKDMEKRGVRVIRSEEDLAALKFDGEYGAVVVDVDSMQDKSAERLHNPEFKGNYFNSGVMYINLQQWLNSNLTKKFFELLSDESIVSRVKYPDQDILNIMFLHHAVLLPRKYNSIYSLKSEFEIKNKNHYKSVINEETVFIHYTGVTKPWHEWANYSSAQFFRTVYEKSPWKNQPYQVAKQKHEYREEYKHLLYQNKIIPGLIAAIKYKTM